ncbi:hypothetical protein H0H81_011419 [Sphagnurus paluster]|uniref:Uncharacterized protein n=1 Tax=Sphagnurus paluster TaxID=117069 RepID=A0A9P7GVH6_9AGAR|nr:hypothetical protein H0H81_011419 [Sphagnurus paluster]
MASNLSPLPTGLYAIQNLATDQLIGVFPDESKVGTSPIKSADDKSTTRNLEWKITHLKEDLYKIEIEGLPAIAINGEVVALVNPTVTVEWKITQLNYLPDSSPVYASLSVKQPHGKVIPGMSGYGWALPSREAGTEVNIEPLMFGAPPQFYDPMQAWKITPLNE